MNLSKTQLFKVVLSGGLLGGLLGALLKLVCLSWKIYLKH